MSERIGLVDLSRMTQTWAATGGNVRAVLRTMFSLPAFWDVRNRGFLFKDPLDFGLGLFQRLGISMDLDRARSCAWNFQQMGHNPFNPPNPAGYPTGLRLAGASMLLQRTQFAWWVIYDLATEAQIVALHGTIAAPVAPDTLVTTIAARLGVPQLSTNTRSAIVAWLGAAPIVRADLVDRTRGIAFLVAASPEYQVM